MNGKTQNERFESKIMKCAKNILSRNLQSKMISDAIMKWEQLAMQLWQNGKTPKKD